MQIVVIGLPYRTTWQELKSLAGASAVHADIAVASNGMSRGFGTVRFHSKEDAQQAIQVRFVESLSGLGGGNLSSLFGYLYLVTQTLSEDVHVRTHTDTQLYFPVWLPPTVERTTDLFPACYSIIELVVQLGLCLLPAMTFGLANRFVIQESQVFVNLTFGEIALENVSWKVSCAGFRNSQDVNPCEGGADFLVLAGWQALDQTAYMDRVLTVKLDKYA